MDFIKKMADGVGGSSSNQSGETSSQNTGHEGGNSGFGGNLMDKVNGMAGGGKQGEENEDGLDKGALCAAGCYCKPYLIPVSTHNLCFYKLANTSRNISG